MELDIKTLLFALLLTFSIQAIAFALMTFTMEKYKGTRLWAIGELMIALGCGSIFLRVFGRYDDLLIMTANFLQIGGIFLFYIGCKKFFDVKTNSNLLIAGFIFFLLIIAYFTFINYHLTARIIAFSVTMVVLSISIARLFIFRSRKSFRRSSLIVGSIFIINSLFFIFRVIHHLTNENIIDFYRWDMMQVCTLIFTMCIGLLWTLSIIVVVNHRLNGELREAKNTFELIFNTIPDAISIIDKESMKYINTNPSFNQFTGYTKAEALETDDFLNKIWDNKVEQSILRDQLTTNGFYNNQEVTILLKNGSEKTALLSSSEITIREKSCILSIGRDVSELKLKDLELEQQTQRLLEVVAEKDKFFSILAHDLRGPISTAVSLTDLIIDQATFLSKEEIIELIITLHKSINSTNELLNNLLEWTGARRGLMSFKRIQIQFPELMNNVLPNLMEIAKNKQISIQNDVPAETTFFADTHMSQAVFRNLIINSIKFTHEGGNIRLSGFQNEKGQMIFSVSDNGIGMNLETLNSLFRIDFKNNRTGTKGEASSGLGLLMCKEFIEKHGGQIWAVSEEKKGSTFYFTFTSI